jgi:hypothetical protein
MLRRILNSSNPVWQQRSYWSWLVIAQLLQYVSWVWNDWNQREKVINENSGGKSHGLTGYCAAITVRFLGMERLCQVLSGWQSGAPY